MVRDRLGVLRLSSEASGILVGSSSPSANTENTELVNTAAATRARVKRASHGSFAPVELTGWNAKEKIGFCVDEITVARRDQTLR